MQHPLSTFIFIPFFVAYFAIRIYWAVKAEKRKAVESKSFLLDKLNVAAMNLLLIVFPLLALFTHYLDGFNYPADDTIILLSIPFLSVGLIVIWLSHKDLGENWSVTLELKQDHSLVTNGIFKHVRHPMYLAIWLCAIGQALCIPNYLGGLGALVGWAFLYFVRINREEQMMIEKFGESYRIYMVKTKRLVPYVL